MIERRKTERIRISDHLVGRVGAVGDARIVDLSMNGVLVENGDSMKPDVVCHFSMSLNGDGEIHIESRVQRCQTSRYVEDGLGNSSFSYRVALQFTKMDSTTQSLLDQYLARTRRRSATPDTARIAQLVRNSE